MSTDKKTASMSRKEKKALEQAKMQAELEKSYAALSAIAAENEATKLSADKTDSYLNEKKSKKETKNMPKVKRELSITSKILLGILALAVLAFIIYIIYYLCRFVAYGKYKQFIKVDEYVEGTVYSPMNDSNPSVKGYDLVGESEYLKLYTNTKTADVAVYDKRTGETIYGSPVNADADTVANNANKDLLKSQFVLGYYNEDVNPGTMNSYTHCVAAGNFTYESIPDGVRYYYSITDGLASFVIPLEYKVADDYIEATIVPDLIQEVKGGYVYRIQMLRYFGATSYDDEGYMVVPNGSGSLIYFNNGKNSALPYSQYVYEIDPLADTYTTLEPEEVARIPLFAICKEDSAVLGTIESEETSCFISADISGSLNDYNYVYPTFVFRTIDDLKDFGNSSSEVRIMENDHYKSNATVRYTLLTKENTGYSGVANYYRNRLIEEGILTTVEAKENIPFYMDVIGAVKETGHFLGVQYLHAFPMTTFDQAAKISDELKESGVENQVMNFQGWFNGGYYHNATDVSVQVMSNLGGKSDLVKLNKTVAANGGTFYGDVAFQKVSEADDAFPGQNVASRYYGSGYVASFGMVNPTTLRNTAGLGYAENRYYVLSPRYLPRYVEGFIRGTKNLAIDGYSLRDLGSYLASDKKRTCPVERDYARDIVEAQYEALEATGKKILTSEANKYSFAYTDEIINAPLADTDYAMIDEQIPLYEMILHGYINYSSDLLNYEDKQNMDKIKLQLIEAGAYPHYVFTYEESSRMKLTALNRYYSTTFANLKDEAVTTYVDVNEALKDVQDAAIISHEILDDDVRKVSYSNGVTIIVNYGRNAAEVDGTTVEAMSYVVEGR